MPDNISLGRTFALFSVYGIAIGIMGIVWVFLLLQLINSSWSTLIQVLAILGMMAGFALYILAAFKIYRLFGTMFGEKEK